MLRTYLCDKGCCSIKIKIISPQTFRRRRRGNCNKSGVFIYDPKEDRVLLVQSRGHLWGPPKGTLEIENDETDIECAIREVMEETGLTVRVEDFSRATKIRNKAIYYYTERDSCDICVQEHDNTEKNDANGITWIKLDCLEKCILDGKIVLNHHCKLLFKRFLNRVFPNSDFIKVKPRHRRKNYLVK